MDKQVIGVSRLGPSLTNQNVKVFRPLDLFPPFLSLAGQPALERVLVVPYFFHLRTMEANVFFGTFNAVEMFWNPSPDLCLDTNLSRTIHLTSWIGFCSGMHCQLWDLIYTGVCLFKSCSIN
jgi:hypothetical protein